MVSGFGKRKWDPISARAPAAFQRRIFGGYVSARRKKIKTRRAKALNTSLEPVTSRNVKHLEKGIGRTRSPAANQSNGRQRRSRRSSLQLQALLIRLSQQAHGVGNRSRD